jgi:hypothetical protein
MTPFPLVGRKKLCIVMPVHRQSDNTKEIGWHLNHAIPTLTTCPSHERGVLQAWESLSVSAAY